MDLDKGWQLQLESYLTTGKGREAVLAVLRRPDSSSYHGVCFVALELSASCSLVLCAALLRPQMTFAEADQILVRCGRKIHEEERMEEPLRKTKLRFRLTSLPTFPEFVRSAVPRSEDVGLILSLTGTVTKMGQTKMLETEKTFRCRCCGDLFSVKCDYEQFYRLDRPISCPNLRVVEQRCKGSQFDPVTTDVNSDMCRDYQEIKIQEKVGSLTLGTIPRSIWVTLEDDLVDACKPGDDLTVIGVVARRWRPVNKFSESQRTNIALAVRANHVKVNNDQRATNIMSDEQTKEFEAFWDKWKWDPLEGRNRILASLCPQIFGMYAVKLAIAVVLCGGVERVDDSGTRVRGEPHMLMVGDPGTGKSQLLRYASKLATRSVFTTGVGSTNAGLTVSAVRDSGEWTLEAGALVLADGGVCCIDEFNSIREADRTCIHEAMEQQSLSVAKAGLVCKLQTRCSVLAATNPKGFFYDPDQPLTVNTGIASPLLSRFDLVFTLLDSKNAEWDKIVSSYVLEGKDPMREMSSGETPWTFDQLQSYISLSKRINPDLDHDASAILTQYYKRQRKGDGYNAARTTVRLLQSSIRIAQGHARLMRHSAVSVLDAVNAVIMLETSTDQYQSLLAEGGVKNALHSTFPDLPAEEYEEQAKVVLYGLDLPNVWEREKKRLDLEREERKRRKRAKRSSETDVVHFEALKEDGMGERENDRLMTQVLSKLKTNQCAFGADEAAVARPGLTAAKRRKTSDKEPKKKRAKIVQKVEIAEVCEKEEVPEEKPLESTDQRLISDSGDLSVYFSDPERLVTSTQNVVNPENEKKLPVKSPKLSTRTLSRLREFQASQSEIKSAPDDKKDAATNVEGGKENERNRLQSIFSDPGEEFNFEFQSSQKSDSSHKEESAAQKSGGPTLQGTTDVEEQFCPRLGIQSMFSDPKEEFNFEL